MKKQMGNRGGDKHARYHYQSDDKDSGAER